MFREKYKHHRLLRYAEWIFIAVFFAAWKFGGEVPAIILGAVWLPAYYYSVYRIQGAGAIKDAIIWGLTEAIFIFVIIMLWFAYKLLLK